MYQTIPLISKVESMENSYWICPVCETDVNSAGNYFSGCRAVSLHIAGKIRSGDTSHKYWAYNVIGDQINGSYVKSSINNLAGELEVFVYGDHQKRLASEQDKYTDKLVVEEAPEDTASRHWRLIEINLHKCVHDTLQEVYGTENDAWWVKGVPSQIRAECAHRRELSPVRGDVFNYVYLLDLKKILDKNWGIFQPHFSKIKDTTDSKSKFLSLIEKLNSIRNRVAHPTYESIYEEDVVFVKQLWDMIKDFAQLE